MTFTSFSYFLFLPLVYLVFYFVNDRYRWLVLLISSYGFYSTFKAPQLILALVFVTMVSYVCALRLGRTADGNQRNYLFWFGVMVCVLLLIGVKLAPRFIPLLAADIQSSYTNLFLSIGISYFSFQAISYLADVYLEIQEPEQHLGYHALALAFFPKLLQGPIERASDLLPQLKKPYQFDYDTMRSGMLLFTWGLFKKVVVADRLALYADQVFNHVHDYTGLPLIIGTYAFALQIYFDFSGYTDMARGTARLFGINLTENFNSPYMATSIADFWRRWHISFSRWILDYIFKPLQMSWRGRGQAGTALALLVTFLISGLWHGLNYGYVIWGLLHGLYLAASTYYRPYQKKLHKLLGVGKSRWLKWWQVFVTFNLVSFAWIFFRAGKLDGIYCASNVLNLKFNFEAVQNFGIKHFIRSGVLLGRSKYDAFAVIVAMLIFLLFCRSREFNINIKSTAVRWCFCYVAIIMIWYFWPLSNKFVYMEF